MTGLVSSGPDGLVKWLKKRSCLIWTIFFAGSQAPWLSLTKMASSGPKPTPLGVRRPPATVETCHVCDRS